MCILIDQRSHFLGLVSGVVWRAQQRWPPALLPPVPVVPSGGQQQWTTRSCLIVELIVELQPNNQLPGTRSWNFGSFFLLLFLLLLFFFTNQQTLPNQPPCDEHPPDPSTLNGQSPSVWGSAVFGIKHVPDLHRKLAQVAKCQPQRPESDKSIYQHIMGPQRSRRGFEDSGACPSRTSTAAAREGPAEGRTAHPEDMEGPSVAEESEDRTSARPRPAVRPGRPGGC